MQLLLTGITATGLRCAELDLRFGHGQPSQFTFIQMPNGTGKTTIAECLRALLSGEAASWDKRDIASFQRVDGSDTGLFEARFLFDDSPLAVGMKFDFAEETVSYYTTIARGRLPKHNLPPSLARFADPGFVRLYIFDAELPHQLLSGGSDRAERAIDAFYQLYVLEELATTIESFWQGQVQGASTQQGLNRNRNRLENLREHRERLKSLLSRAEKDLREMRAELQEKEPELERHLSQVERYRQEKAELEQELKIAEADLTSAMNNTVSRLQRPLDLHPVLRDTLDRVAAGLDSLKLPESTSRAFFIDLAKQVKCICGGPMTSEAKENIMRAAERLLSDDTAGVINAFKNDVRSFHRDDSSPTLAHLSDQIANLIRQRDTARSHLEVLRTDASDRADERARQLKERIDDLKFRSESVERSIEAMTREPRLDDDESSGCIRWFEQEIRRLDDIVAEATRLVTLRKQKDDLKLVLEKAAELARDDARRELVTAMNARLEVLLPGENLRVADIGASLTLEGREGVNLGAMLSIGYSFLTTLFERGNHQFPFIVDAPSMGLDGLARERLAEILPRTTHQFVGFILDNERDFARHVKSNVPEGCEFYTVFSDSSRNRPLANQVPPETERGQAGTYIVEGFDFFDRVIWSEMPGGGS